MNILQIRSELRDNGPGTQPITLSVELRSRGHVVTFASSGGVLVEKVKDLGFDFEHVPELAVAKRLPHHVFRAVSRLARIMRVRSIDVVHAHNAACTAIASMAACLVRQNVRVVQSVRGLEQRESHQHRNLIYRVLPARFLAVSEYTARELIRIGVAESRVSVSYNGVDLSRFFVDEAKRSEARRLFDLGNEFVVGHVGAFSGWKGQEMIVRLVSNLRGEGVNLVAVLVGDGPTFEATRDLASELGILDKVHFTGFQSDTSLFYHAFDLYAQPSIKGEMLPNSIIEGMATGLPWVGSDISGLSELSDDGRAGLVFNAGNLEAMSKIVLSLVENTDLRRKMGHRASEFAKSKFSVQRVVNRVENAYSTH